LHTGQVNIQLSRWENGQWVFNRKLPASLTNGSYQAWAKHLGHGKWRAKAVLPLNDWVWPSESAYHEFVITPSNLSSTGDEDSRSPGPRAVADCNASENVFYRTPSGTLGHSWFQPSSNVWGGATIPGSLAANAEPRPVIDSMDNLNVFYRTSTGTLGHSWFQPSSNVWGGATIPGSLAANAEPRPVIDSMDNLNVFYRTPNGTLGHSWFQPSSNVWGAETLPGSLGANAEPHPMIDSKGNLNVFYRTPSGTLGHTWFQPSSNVWGAGTLPGAPASEPHPVIDSKNDLHVYFRTPSGTLGHTWFQPSSNVWGAEVLPGSLASEPRPLIDVNDSHHVYYRTPSGTLGHSWFQPSANVWGAETLPGSVAATKPTVVTGPASGIKVTEAKVEGTVNPQGAPTTYYFEYGATTDYGSKEPFSAKGIGYGHDALAVAETLSGLAATTEYHYRVVAVSPEGTTYGADETFTTNGPQPTTTTGTGEVTAPRAATLKGTVNPNGFATTYEFEYGTTTAYGSSVPVPAADAGSGTSTQSVEAALSGLSANTTYHYRLVAKNSNGTTLGEDKTFTTPPWTPEAITGHANPTSLSTATLHGTVNPSGFATTYQFEYGTTHAYGSSVPVPAGAAGSGTSPQGLQAALSGLSANTTYHYRLMAKNSNGTTYGADRTFKIHPLRFQAAQYPATLSGSQEGAYANVLTTEGGGLECAGASVSGQLPGTSQALSLTPTYSACKAFGFASASVVTNGCTYELALEGTRFGAHYPATFGIACPQGKAIEVTAGNCTVAIPSQGGRGPAATSTDLAAAQRGIEVEFGVANLKYTVTKDGFLCPFAGTGAKEGGRYTGSTMVVGKNALQDPIDVEVAGVEVEEPHPPRFESAGYPTALSGGQNLASAYNMFATEAGSVECGKATVAGQLAAASATLTLSPTYSECKGLGSSATVTTNGCTYQVALAGTKSGEKYPGTMSIACPEGKAIEIVAGNCTVAIGAQSGLSTVNASNDTAATPQRVEVDFKVAKLKYTVTKDGFLCPFSGTGGKENGGYTGPTSVKATTGSPSAVLGLRVSGG
jgi:hypothetical protein